MAVLESGNDGVQATSQGSGAIGARRHMSRARAAVETFLALMLIALGVFVLRFVLVVAHGVLA